MKRIFVIIVSFLTLLFIPNGVEAKTEYDTYYVSITLKNLDEANYSLMLLTTGPGSVNNGDGNIYNVELPEGYKYSNALQKFRGTSTIYEYKGQISRSFKVLLYNEDSNEFLISDELIIYGAQNYWTCNYSNGYKFIKSYNYSYAVAMFFVKMIVIILMQIALAFVYKFNKKSHWIIFGTNTSLQFFANLYLNIQTYNFGITPFSKGIGCLVLFFVECVIFIISLITYKQYCSRNKIVVEDGIAKEIKTKDSILKYVLLICIISFIIGSISLIIW